MVIDEKLSALMDGELDERETLAVLENIRHDSKLRAVWGRQHYLRMAMTERPPEEVGPEFADGVMARIALEATELECRVQRPSPFTGRSGRAASGARRRGWYRPITGVAVAASVAAVAVIVMNQGGEIESGLSGTSTVAASAPHAERVARSTAVAESATTAEAVEVVPVGEAEMTQVAQTEESTAQQAASESASVQKVAVETESADAGLEVAASEVASGDLESLISSEASSPLNWDATALAEDEELRQLLFGDSHSGDSESVAGMLGMRTTAGSTAAKAEPASEPVQ